MKIQGRHQLTVLAVLVYEKVDAKESIALWERYIALAGALPSEKDWVDVAKLHLKKLRSQQEKGR